jgi:signal transduction histidine kinase/CheY-like chemotaxis protein
MAVAKGREESGSSRSMGAGAIGLYLLVAVLVLALLGNLAYYLARTQGLTELGHKADEAHELWSQVQNRTQALILEADPRAAYRSWIAAISSFKADFESLAEESGAAGLGGKGVKVLRAKILEVWGRIQTEYISLSADYYYLLSSLPVASPLLAAPLWTWVSSSGKDDSYFRSAVERVSSSQILDPAFDQGIAGINDAIGSEISRSRNALLASSGLIALACVALVLFLLWRQLSSFAAAARSQLAVTQELRAALNAKEDFLSHVGHELRTPLMGIVGMLELLKGGALDAEQKALIGNLDRSASSLGTITNDLLDFVRMGREKFTLNPEDFEIAPLLRDLAESFRPSAQAKGLELELELPAGGTFRGDPARVAQIVGNLLSNAVKYTAAGRIVLAVEVRGPSASPIGDGGDGRGIREGMVIRVEDTGQGIPEEFRTRIFESFFQLGHSAATKALGLGLGLSIVRGIVSAMGGGIELESEPGKGSSFVVSLPGTVSLPSPSAEPAAQPVAESAPAAAPAASVAAAPNRSSKGSVLLAEDDAIIRLALSKYLERSGFEVAVAANGLEAVDAARAGSFDIAVLDLNMPVMDGRTAAKEIRAMGDGRGSVPALLALTGQVFVDEAAFLEETGFDLLVYKPVREAPLAEKLHSLLRARDGGQAAPFQSLL